MTQTTQKLKTINVRIPEDELMTYREHAFYMGKSFSQMVRDLLSKSIIPGVNTKSTKKKKYSFWDVDKYSVPGGDRKASQSVDKYVYKNP